jgi:hypothetical protein
VRALGRLHDLRHGAASRALAAGVDLKVVAEFDLGLVPHRTHLGPTTPEKVRAGTHNACSDRVRRQGLEPRTRGLRVRCSAN